jgi:hypothetical protein
LSATRLRRQQPVPRYREKIVCKVPSGPVVIGKDGVSFDPAQSAKPQISPLRYASVEMTNL